MNDLKAEPCNSAGDAERRRPLRRLRPSTGPELHRQKLLSRQQQNAQEIDPLQAKGNIFHKHVREERLQAPKHQINVRLEQCASGNARTVPVQIESGLEQDNKVEDEEDLRVKKRSKVAPSHGEIETAENGLLDGLATPPETPLGINFHQSLVM